MRAIVTYKDDSLLIDVFENVSSAKEAVNKAVERLKSLKPNIAFPTRVVTTIGDKAGDNNGTFIETINSYIEFIDDIEFEMTEVFAVLDREYAQIDAIYTTKEGAEDWIKQMHEWCDDTQLYMEEVGLDPVVKEYIENL